MHCANRVTVPRTAGGSIVGMRPTGGGGDGLAAASALARVSTAEKAGSIRLRTAITPLRIADASLRTPRMTVTDGPLKDVGYASNVLRSTVKRLSITVGALSESVSRGYPSILIGVGPKDLRATSRGMCVWRRMTMAAMPTMPRAFPSRSLDLRPFASTRVS